MLLQLARRIIAIIGQLAGQPVLLALVCVSFAIVAAAVGIVVGSHALTGGDIQVIADRAFTGLVFVAAMIAVLAAIQVFFAPARAR